MRLLDSTLEELREINIRGLSDRQLSELQVELLMRLVCVKRRKKKNETA